MPKRAASTGSVVEDSEAERTSRPKSKTNGKSKDQDVADDASVVEGDGDDDDGGEETEYEIEEILGHRRNEFGPGSMGYLVKWKGFGPEENSYVDERDAAGAQEMIDEYWLKNKNHKDNPNNKRKAGRPSSGKKSSAKAKASSDVEGEEPPKKRRTSKVNESAKKEKPAPVDVDDEDQPRPKKKQKTYEASRTMILGERPKMANEMPSLDAEQLAARRAANEDEDEQGDPELGTMQSFMHLRSWEHLVQSIQTVEGAKDHTLRVYFVIKDNGVERRVVEDSSVCDAKFPQKMLRFYQSHLRWRETDPEEVPQES